MASDLDALDGMRQSRALKATADAAKRVRALELLAEGHAVKDVALRISRPRNLVAAWKKEAQNGY